MRRLTFVLAVLACASTFTGPASSQGFPHGP